MEIFSEVGKLIFVGYTDGLINALKKVTYTFVTSIKIAGIFGAERTHKVVDTILRVLFEHKVKVIGHEAVGEEFYFAHIVFELFRWSDWKLILRG